MNDLSLKVDVAAGSKIADTIREAVNLRAKTGVNIEYVFNGVTIWVTCTSILDFEVNEAVKKYHEALSKSPDLLKFVRV